MYAHLVFSTKNRSPLIRTDWSSRLYDYIGGIVSHRDGVLLAAGGMSDHVHLLVSLGRKWSLADLLRDIKAGSSKWVHDNFAHDHAFGWQDGYGAFSVSASKLEAVERYIVDQPRHHEALSFQDELRGLLRKHGLTWDERYIWD
jgi:REP element-mobilizing transposase RayT